ncbi:MAG TPA: lysylphosphatidylglycerol synthase domain-containing protein [Chitinophagales bacterium]|nr:lysylphosphatidylglycerol synthase domain-containing protein [Chitinophagales bacterium]
MNWLRNKYVKNTLMLALLVLMGWFIVQQLFIKNDFDAQVAFFKQNINTANAWLLILAVLLMPINWLLETFKWKLLIKSAEPFMHLFKSVIAGTTLGFVTPGRTGEFVGRVLFVKEENKAKIFYLSSIGGIAQSVATLCVGVFLVFMWSGNSFFYGLTMGVAIAFLLVYFRFDLLNRFISSNAFLQKHSLVIGHDELPGVALQFIVLLLSFIRFGVYLTQYVLLLMFFGVSTDFFALLVHSGVFLVAQTFSPMMPFVDVSYRGGSALYVFHNFTTNNIGVLTAVMMVWLINLVIPSLVGYLFIVGKGAKRLKV